MPDTFESALRLVADSLPQPVFLCDPDGRAKSGNGAFENLLAVEEWWRAVRPEDEASLRVRWSAGLAAGEAFEAEARLQCADGREPWFRIRAVPIRPEGRVRGWIVTFTDIDSDRAADEHRQALAREMSHRVKNLFAMVNGLVSMTARSAGSPQEMAASLRGRVGALSRAQELVRSAHGAEPGESASLDGLVRAILAPYAQTGERVAIDGPPLTIGPAAVTNLALVLHELAANAAKFGSLSASGGHLDVSWAGQGDEIALRWTESGGPPVAANPGAEGFGTQLARRTVTGQLGGEMRHDWRPGGLQLTMTLSRERLAC